MVKCPYCLEEFKKITSSHLKKHGIAYKTYLMEYESEKYYLVVLTDFIWEFYVPQRNKYIEQVSFKGNQVSWVTKHAMGKKYLDKEIVRYERQGVSLDMMSKLSNIRPYPFSKSDIRKHLKNEITLGIYSQDIKSAFLTFDIDEDNLDYVERIYNTLRCYGILDNEILISYSGNKGYHISIFFDSLIEKIKLRKLFEIVLREANLKDLKRENGSDVIELRGANDQAVKLPFSINRKNSTEYKEILSWYDWEYRQAYSKGNYCYLINTFGCEIATVPKILSMRKIERIKVLETINDYYEDELFKHSRRTHRINEVDTPVKEPEIKLIVKSEQGINRIIETNMDGIIEPAMRNRRLLQIAVYNKSKGMSAEENLKFLIEFSMQKKHKFRTSQDDNINEIKSIIKTIYYSDTAGKYKVAGYSRCLTFSKREMLEILSVNEKSIRKLYFIMIVHFKIYGNKRTGQFYMKYETIRNALNIDGKAINMGLLKLEKLKKIVFIRKGEKDKESGQNKNLPNIYEIAFKEGDIIADKQYRLLRKENDREDNFITYSNFEMMCAKVLSIKEIKEYFSNSSQIIKYKYQKLIELL